MRDARRALLTAALGFLQLRPRAPRVSASPGTPDPWTWAALIRRVDDLDGPACPRWDGRLRVTATVQDPLAVQAILAHRARSGAHAPPGPAPPASAALL